MFPRRSERVFEKPGSADDDEAADGGSLDVEVFAGSLPETNCCRPRTDQLQRERRLSLYDARFLSSSLSLSLMDARGARRAHTHADGQMQADERTCVAIARAADDGGAAAVHGDKTMCDAVMFSMDSRCC